MMKTFSFYRLDTGEVTGRRFTGTDESAQKNTPAGCGVIEGRYDRLTQRVQDGRVVEWLNKPAALEARHERALRDIEAIERSIARPLRELLLDPQNAEARRRVAEADERIAGLRSQLLRQALRR